MNISRMRLIFSLLKLKQEDIKEMKILIDVGHGGKDSGAVSKDVLEKDLNLQIAKKLYTILLGKGFDVDINRTKDVEIPLQQRVRECNVGNYDLFLSIHCNAFSNPKVKGVETVYFPTSRNGKIIANSIITNIKEMTQKNHRSAKRDDRGLFVLRSTKCPAVIVECGFITNNGELLMLGCETYQWIMAISIMKGVVDYEEKTR